MAASIAFYAIGPCSWTTPVGDDAPATVRVVGNGLGGPGKVISCSLCWMRARSSIATIIVTSTMEELGVRASGQSGGRSWTNGVPVLRRPVCGVADSYSVAAAALMSAAKVDT